MLSLKLSYCISIDSSKYTEAAFELILNEFYTKGDKLNAIQIKNTEKEKSFPFLYKTSKKLDSCGSNYRNYNKEVHRSQSTKNVISDYKSVCIEKSSVSSYSYKQFIDLSTDLNADLLVVGYKENNKKNKEIHSGMLNLFQNANSPVMIVKEYPTRKTKNDGGFYWLVCIKNSYGKSFKAFQKILSFIDITKDNVRGVCLKSKNGWYDKELEKNFKNYCKERGLKRYSFKYLDKDKDDIVTVGKQLSNIINFGEEFFDFIVLGCSPNNYFYLENNPVVEVVRLAQANILYSNGILLLYRFINLLI